MDFNQILKDYVGEMGRFQMFVVCLLLVVRFPSAIHNMGYVFYASTPSHWCSFPRAINMTSLNDTVWKLFSIPSKMVAGERQFSRCKIYTWVYEENITPENITRRVDQIRQGVAFHGNTELCTRWEYDRVTGVSNSLVTEYDMVCDRAWMKSMVATAYVIGWIAAAPASGYLSDRYGRRRTLLVVATGTVLFGVILPFCNNYIAFLMVRMLVSASINSTMGIAYTTCMEVVGPRWRSSIGSAYWTVWAVGYMIIAVVAYALRDRFIFMIAIAIPTVIILIPAGFIPESIPWLIAKGRKEEANKLVYRMAKMNKRPLPDKLEVTVQEETEKNQTTYMDLVRTPNMRKITFILFLHWFLDVLVFYAISWNSAELSENIYMNVFLGGAVEIPAYMVTIVLLQKVGRKFSMISSTLFAGVLLLSTLAVTGGRGSVMVGLTISAKFFISIALTIVYQWTIELYPTLLRATGLMMCTFVARMGALLAPYLPLLGTTPPQILCGTLAVVATLPLFMLPETLNKELPTNIDEAERFGKVTWREAFHIPWLADPKDDQRTPSPDEELKSTNGLLRI